MRLQKFVTTACLGAMIAVSAPVAGASAPSPSKPAASTVINTASSQVGQQPSQKTIQLLEKYVKATPSGYVMNAPAEILKQVDAKELQAIKSYQSQLAGYIKQGEMIYSDGTYVPLDSLTYTTWKSQHAKITTHWYGLEVGLDGWLTGKIRAGALGAGAIAGYIGGPYGKGIGLALALGSSVLGLCQKKSGWVYIYWVGVTPPAGTPVCNPF